MKLLLQYLKPYKGLVMLTLLLAAINIIFSLIDPILFGKIIKLAEDYVKNEKTPTAYNWDFYFWEVMKILFLSMGTAMVSRIAKNFQDYYTNVIVQKTGTQLYTDALRHAFSLPYSVFEDERSGSLL